MTNCDEPEFGKTKTLCTIDTSKYEESQQTILGRKRELICHARKPEP